jgi:ribosomal protein S18 acetylase RimI-like enzyme
VSGLDNVIWTSLTGVHAPFSTGDARARRYVAGFSPFAAVEDPSDPTCFNDLARIVEPGEAVVLSTGTAIGATPGFVQTFDGPGHQLIATDVDAVPSPRAVRLTVDHVPAMVDLAARTKPGPFSERTIQFGTYVGIVEDGVLLAMAGQRFDGGVGREISAVCTDPSAQGRGLATELVAHLVHLDRLVSCTAFLHVATTNERAYRLYRHLGFTERRTVTFAGYVRES